MKRFVKQFMAYSSAFAILICSICLKGSHFFNNTVAFGFTQADFEYINGELAIIRVYDKVDSIAEVGGSKAEYSQNSSVPTSFTPVKIIGARCYANHDEINEITISNNVTKIYGGAFEDCKNLKTVTIGDNVELIKADAFKGCEKLTTINNTDKISCSDLFYSTPGTPWRLEHPLCIVNNALTKCDERVTEITIPDTVTEIQGGSLGKCEQLTHITILNPDCKFSLLSSDSKYIKYIHGYKGSTAEKYAKARNKTFIEIKTRGDINFDGKYTISDLVLLQIYLLSADVLSARAMCVADMDSNNIVNAADMSLLKRKLMSVKQFDPFDPFPYKTIFDLNGKPSLVYDSEINNLPFDYSYTYPGNYTDIDCGDTIPFTFRVVDSTTYTFLEKEQVYEYVYDLGYDITRFEFNYTVPEISPDYRRTDKVVDNLYGYINGKMVPLTYKITACEWVAYLPDSANANAKYSVQRIKTGCSILSDGGYNVRYNSVEYIPPDTKETLCVSYVAWDKRLQRSTIHYTDISRDPETIKAEYIYNGELYTGKRYEYVGD